LLAAAAKKDDLGQKLAGRSRPGPASPPVLLNYKSLGRRIWVRVGSARPFFFEKING
jgi:hypothetical protein